MIVSGLMARRRAAMDITPTVTGALWPLLLDLVALAGFVTLIIGIMVGAAYSEPRDDGAWPMIVMLGGIVVFAGCLSNALVTTWRVMRSR